jgi:hypothetical protein
VRWDPVRKQVTINNGYMIVLGLGSKMLLSDGEPFIQMDVAPEMRDGNMMLPIRFLGEALGEKIDWNQAAQAVTLTMTYTG